MAGPAPLAVAVLGCGTHGARYAEHLLRGEVPGARLAGVQRRTASAAAGWGARGVRFETDPLALAEDPAVDALVVASAPAAHRAHAEAVLAAGKPLLLEKPVAPDRDGCAAVARAAARAGVPVLVGHTVRYNPVARAFRAAVREAGGLRFLGLSMRHERLDREWHADRAEGGGALLSCGVHMADLARWVTGSGIGEVVACETLPGPSGAEGAAAALARMEGGATLFLEVSIVAPSRRGGLEAWGDGGQVEGDYLAHGLWRRVGRERVPVPLDPPVPGIVPLLGDFVRAARGGPAGEAATLEDGVAAVRFVEACFRAEGAKEPASTHHRDSRTPGRL